MTRNDQSGHQMSRRRLLTVVGGLTVSGVALSGAALAELAAGRRPHPVADSTPLPGPARPQILDCAGWRAREPSEELTELLDRPVKVVIHHTATSPKDDEALSLDVLARAIQNYHMDTKEWADSGHHFLVNQAGLIAEGRHGSLDTLLVGKHFIEGTHCPGQNESSIGIENEGDYTEVTPPATLLLTLPTLCAFICLQYGIKPGQLYGHRDFSDTACPGDRFYALLPTVRAHTAALLTAAPKGAPKIPPNARANAPHDVGPSQVTGPPTWPLLRVADRGPAVLAAQHLLRAAGMPGVSADGEFGRTTADGVFAFQRAHGLDQTGMIGGGSWPLLAVPVRVGQGGEAEAAVQALLANRPNTFGQTMPDTVQGPTWQRLLGTG